MGVICCILAIYQPAYITSGIFQSPPPLHKVKSASKQGEIGQKLIFICSFLSYLGIFGDRNSENAKIFLKVGVGCWLFVCLSSCPVVQVFRTFQGFRTYLNAGSGPLVLLSSALSLGALALNMALFRVLRAFLARFWGFVWVCVVLGGLGGL